MHGAIEILVGLVVLAKGHIAAAEKVPRERVVPVSFDRAFKVAYCGLIGIGDSGGLRGVKEPAELLEDFSVVGVVGEDTFVRVPC